MARSTVNPNDVAFSAGSIIEYGPRPAQPTVQNLEAALSSLVKVGKLEGDVTLDLSQTVRQKMDRFPEVVVAEAIQAQNAAAQFVCDEFNSPNLQLGLGLESGDVTAVAANGDTPGYTQMPVGQRATVVYRIVRITEELTNGRIYQVIFWRARLGMNSQQQLNAVQGGSIPMTLQALFEPVMNVLASTRLYDIPGGE